MDFAEINRALVEQGCAPIEMARKVGDDHEVLEVGTRDGATVEIVVPIWEPDEVRFPEILRLMAAAGYSGTVERRGSIVMLDFSPTLDRDA